VIQTSPTIGLAMPTDADWGRLYNYNTTGDAGLVMPFRSYYFRNFFAGNWQELMIGMIFRNSGAGGDYTSVTAERQNENFIGNLFHFGLSKSANGAIDVANNPSFIGLRGVQSGLSQITTGPIQLANLKLTCVSNGNSAVTGLNQIMPLSEGTPTNPFTMIGLRFIADPVSRKVYITYAVQQNVALADDAANTTTLSNFLQGISRNEAEADGAFPIYDVINFNAFYIYWPYLNNRLFLQTVGVIKFQ
jgi:hypothetical protein